MTVKLLLASKSPRRRELIGQLGLEFRVVDIDVDERLESDIAVDNVAEAIACKKATGYRYEIGPSEVLVTADTVVVHRGKVLGKPHSRQEAIEMLNDLSGDVHQVYTGVCLRGQKGQESFTECTHVYFRNLTDDEISFYVDTYKPFDKAGAYGIQEWIGMVGIERIEGCFYNVMGLPTVRLYKELMNLMGGK